MWLVLGVGKWLIFTALGRGIWALLATKGIHPDQWVSSMILAAGARQSELATAIRWLGSGIFGLLCLVIWDAAHVDERIASAWPFQSAADRFRWKPLTSLEESRLRASLRSVEDPKLTYVRCGDSDCRELADSLLSVFHSLGWHNVEREYDLAGGNISPTGIMVEYSRNDFAATIATAIENATDGRLKANFQQNTLIPLRIFLGPKPD